MNRVVDIGRVSIVITAYNDEETVEQAIESALKLDWPGPTEVIVVLDGPTDRTADRAGRFRGQVRIILKTNGGTASARNCGLSHASGDWIQYLDADDALLPGKLCASLAAYQRAFNRDHIALIYTGYHNIDRDRRILSTHCAEPYSRERLFQADGHVTPNPIIRTKALREVGGYSRDYLYAEDTEIYHRLAITGKMLAVPEPHFLKGISPAQKSSAMQRHSLGDLVVEEPRRIRETYADAFRKHRPPWMSRIGELSKRGVLDVGVKCTHSCKFCYYSYLDGSDDQFRGIRRAKMRPLEECKRILDNVSKAKLTHFDITGGEPTLHPDIVEIVRYGFQELGLRARIITLGQFLTRKMGKGQTDTLIERLIDAGMDDFLLSVHAVRDDLFQEITGENYGRLRRVMDHLDDRDFSYCTNTVVHEANYRHLPDIATALLGRRVRIANFITMNAYYQWRGGDRINDTKARYRDQYPYVQQAVRLLEEHGVGVNIRYGPLCAYRGMEKNFVGVMGVELDPYEWRTDLDTGLIRSYASVDDYVARQRAVLDSENSAFAKGPECQKCAARSICDGVDRTYIEKWGWSEFTPYPIGPGAEPITNPAFFRIENPGVFELKCEGRTGSTGSLNGPSALTMLYGDLGWCPSVAGHLSSGNLDAAIGELREQLATWPGEIPTYFQLHQLYQRVGDTAAAEELGRKIESMDDLPTREVLRWRLVHQARLLRGLPGTRRRLSELLIRQSSLPTSQRAGLLSGAVGQA